MAPLSALTLKSHAGSPFKFDFIGALVVPATAAACLWLCGGNLSRSVGGWEAMQFCLGLALAETLLFTPLVAIRSVETLRQLNLARDELDRLTGVDPLTGLLNRRGFEKAAAALAAAPEARGAPVAALVCDVDEFKQINNSFGHDFGDAGRRRLADMLRGAAGDRGFALGRHGGDELVVPSSASRAAKRSLSPNSFAPP